MNVGDHEYKYMMEELDSFTEDLNTWECQFIESLRSKPDNMELSELQESKFNEIYERVTNK